MKKEKVVAVRLTQSQWEALEWARANAATPIKMSQFVAVLLKPYISAATQDRADLLKKQEAAAKRKATREAKKVASDDAK